MPNGYNRSLPTVTLQLLRDIPQRWKMILCISEWPHYDCGVKALAVFDAGSSLLNVSSLDYLLAV